MFSSGRPTSSCSRAPATAEITAQIFCGGTAGGGPVAIMPAVPAPVLNDVRPGGSSQFWRDHVAT